MFNGVEQKPAMNLLFFQRGVGCCRACGSINMCKESDSGKPISFKSGTVVFHFFSIRNSGISLFSIRNENFKIRNSGFSLCSIRNSRVCKDGFKFRRFSCAKRRCGGWCILLFSEEFAKTVSNVVVSLVGRGDAASGGGPAGAPPGRRDQPERLVRRRGGGGGTVLRTVKTNLDFAKT